MIITRLTTPDNPYDVFTQFEDWYRYDNEKDYGTCDFLARFTHTSSALSDTENEEEISRAIEDILLHDPRNLYIAVTKEIKTNDFSDEENETENETENKK